MQPKKNGLLAAFFAAGLFVAGTSQAAYISEVEPNNSIAQAQSLDGHFTTDYDADITNSTTMAHASVTGTGDGTWDYYSFTLSALSSVIFDIDYGMPDLDSWLNIYDAAGTRIAYNDDSSTIDPGSSHHYDSYLSTTLAAGVYYIAVGQYSNSPISSGKDYTLHVSASYPAAVPLPAAAPLLLSGLGILGALGSKRRKKAI